MVIGAGSYFFARPVIWNMVNSPVLRGGTLALVDTQPKVLETIMGVARRAAGATAAPLTLEGATDRGEVLPGADFVVLTFSDRKRLLPRRRQRHQQAARHPHVLGRHHRAGPRCSGRSGRPRSRWRSPPTWSGWHRTPG